MFPFEIVGRMRVTMKATPASPECEIFLVSIFDDDDGPYHYVCIDSYSSSTGFAENSELLGRNEMIATESHIYNVLYMKGHIYCLFENGKLNRYRLEDKSWELLTSVIPEHYTSLHYTCNVWLVEINVNLMFVAMRIEGKQFNWKIFRFDWSGMSWVAETGLKSCAIYISDELAFSAPLTDQNGKDLEGCRVFYYNRFVDVAGGRGFKCFSLSEAGGTRMINSKEYGWIERSNEYPMSFIQPPYFGI